MKYKFILFFILLIQYTNAQDLSKHQWNDRILLVISEDFKTDQIPNTYLNQVNELQNHIDGLAERKMVIYKVFPSECRYLNTRNNTVTAWIKSDSLFSLYNQENAPFKVVLIGLDGSIKETRTDLFSTQELFTIIDGMSMRKAELRRKN